MTARDGDSLHAPIDSKLGELADALPAKPSWHGRWHALDSDSPAEERLAVYQAVRDSGILPEDAGFYLVSWQADVVAEKQAETSLKHLDDRLDAIQVEHGLADDEVWDPDEAPPEYRELLGQYNDAWDALFADMLETVGEHEIARLFRSDRDEYELRSEAGRQYFFGPLSADEIDDSDLLDALIDAVANSLEPESPMGPLKVRYSEEDGMWEVDIYPTPVELVGGAEDGAIVTPSFSLDIEQLRASFERIDDAGWNSFGWADGRGPFVWVEGLFLGREVWLRVLAQAPDDEEPGATFRVTRTNPG